LPTDGKALPDDPQQAAALAERLVKTNERMQDIFERQNFIARRS
jgi:hypothetical protein